MKAWQREVWIARFDPVEGHEQGGTRPCVVISSDSYNRYPINMAMVVALTTRDRGLDTQPRVDSEPSGLSQQSFARGEDVRAISQTRLLKRIGQVSAAELTAIQRVVRLFLDLP